MRLIELEPSFIKISDSAKSYDKVEGISEAQGVLFRCPSCFIQKGGKIGVHSIICWFDGKGVPDNYEPKPGRWNPSGTGLNDLSFVGPGATSVLIEGHAHFHIDQGEVKMC